MTGALLMDHTFTIRCVARPEGRCEVHVDPKEIPDLAILMAAEYLTRLTIMAFPQNGIEKNLEVIQSEALKWQVAGR